MKKFVMSYIFISLLFAVALYFTTLTLSYNERVYEIFQEFSEDAKLNQDFDAFVRYQSIEYKRIGQMDTENYSIFIYHIIGTESTEYMNQLGFFILPKSNIKYAISVDDPLDQTKLVLTDMESNEVIYDTSIDKAYEAVAISYGIEKMGYYFYTYNMTEDILLKIQLYDYDGFLIKEINQGFEYQAYPMIDNTFNPGISQEELETLIDQETNIYPKLMRNMTIYIIIDVLFGSLLYFFIKYKKNHL